MVKVVSSGRCKSDSAEVCGTSPSPSASVDLPHGRRHLAGRHPSAPAPLSPRQREIPLPGVTSLGRRNVLRSTIYSGSFAKANVAIKLNAKDAASHFSDSRQGLPPSGRHRGRPSSRHVHRLPTRLTFSWVLGVLLFRDQSPISVREAVTLTASQERDHHAQQSPCDGDNRFLLSAPPM
jgi:hypothetical protein